MVFLFGAVPDHADARLAFPAGGIADEVVSDGFDAVDALFAVVPGLLIVRQVGGDEACDLWRS